MRLIAKTCPSRMKIAPELREVTITYLSTLSLGASSSQHLGDLVIIKIYRLTGKLCVLSFKIENIEAKLS